MKSIFTVFLFFIFSISIGFSQVFVTGTGCIKDTICFGATTNVKIDTVFNFSHSQSFNGNTYNVYTSFLGGFNCQIQYDTFGMQWRIWDACEGQIMFTNSNSTAPNPPANGWSSGMNECGSASSPTLFGDVVLPVELISFKAQSEGQSGYLTWQTASELNNDGFEIENSANGRDWQMIDFVAGNGTSFEQQSYSYTHRKPNAGINYYRLKQIDFDGAYEYSKTVSIDMESAGNGFSLFPNPTGGSGQLSVNIDMEQSGIMTFYNAFGKRVFELPFDENESRLEVDLPDLPAGIYTAEMTSGRERFAKRLIVQ